MQVDYSAIRTCASIELLAYRVIGRRSAHIVVRVRIQFKGRRQDGVGGLTVTGIAKPRLWWLDVEREPSAGDVSRLLISQAAVMVVCCNVQYEKGK